MVSGNRNQSRPPNDREHEALIPRRKIQRYGDEANPRSFIRRKCQLAGQLVVGRAADVPKALLPELAQLIKQNLKGGPRSSGLRETSATISEAVAHALSNARDLPEEVSAVAQSDIAGAGFEPATFGL